MEIVVRLLGYSHWNPDTEVNIIIDPGGKLSQVDSLLGYKHLPGSYHVTLPTGLEFDITHGETTLRSTRASDTYLDETLRPEIWIFGGSFAHGWSIEDYETFPWLLQEQLPDFDVINFGVGGYGTIQGLLKLQQLFADGRRPHLIILAYSALHDERNTFMRSRIKEVASWNHLGKMNQPYARVSKDDELILRYREAKYRAVSLTRFLAVAHCLDLAINKIQHHLIDSHEVTRHILNQISELADTNDTSLVLANIYNGPDTVSLLDWATEIGLNNVDIAVDLKQEGMSNRPFDAHPSAQANRHYATKLYNYLTDQKIVSID
jgi:hypothetical protein